MTVAELAAHLLALPHQHMAVCLPPEEGEGEPGLDFRDPHEVVGSSRWDGDYIDAGGHALIRGPYVRIDAVED